MQRRPWLNFLASCVLVALVAFALGRSSGSTKRPSSAGPAAHASGAASSAPSLQAAEAKDFTRVRIENLGEVEFDQAYELIHAAPKEALSEWTRRLEALPVTPRKTAAIAVFFKTLAQIDAKTAVDVALTMERAESRWTAIGAISIATPAANLPEVARMYSALHEDRIPVAGDLIVRWSATDPEATARFLSRYPGKVQNDDLASFMWNWAARDPAAATNWLTNADANRRDEGVYVGYYNGWMLQDRAGALADLAAHSSEKTFGKAIKSVSENLFTESAEAARDFVLSLADDKAQEAAVGQIAGHITGFYFGGDYLHLKADGVTKWVFTLPDKLSQEHLGSLVDHWAREDEASVAAWLNQMPLATREQLMAKQCLAHDWNQPSSSLRAGLHISDSELRETTLRQVFKEMNEEGRQELLQKAQLSVEDAAELKRILKRL